QESGEALAARLQRDRYRKSILDFVREDAERLQTELGATDRRKLDEYLTSVREIEQRLVRASQHTEPVKQPDYAMPAGIPKELQDHIRLMCDMMVLAFQGDLTRIATLVLANDGSNRPYPFIGVPEGHHDLSHHGNDKKKQQKIATINKFHVTQFAYL